MYCMSILRAKQNGIFPIRPGLMLQLIDWQAQGVYRTTFANFCIPAFCTFLLSSSTAALIPRILQVQRSRRQFPNRAAVHQAWDLAWHVMAALLRGYRGITFGPKMRKMSAYCCLLIDFNVCQPFSVLPGHMYDGQGMAMCHNSRPSNVQQMWPNPHCLTYPPVIKRGNGNPPIYRFYRWFATKTSIFWWISHRISLQIFPPAGCRIALRAMYSCMRQLLDGSDAEAPSWCPHFIPVGEWFPQRGTRGFNLGKTSQQHYEVQIQAK